MTHFIFLKNQPVEGVKLLRVGTAKISQKKSLLMDVTLLLNFTFYYWEQYQI